MTAIQVIEAATASTKFELDHTYSFNYSGKLREATIVELGTGWIRCDTPDGFRTFSLDKIQFRG